MPKKREVRQRRREAGICTECGTDRPLVTKSICDVCYQQKMAAIKKIRDNRIENSLCPTCAAPIDEFKMCGQCRDRKRVIRERGDIKVKQETFAAYGGASCTCCGENIVEFLDLDHINGGGNQERKLLGTGTKFYRKLRIRGFPPGYQVLCANCNRGKSVCGECPHKRVTNVR